MPGTSTSIDGSVRYSVVLGDPLAGQEIPSGRFFTGTLRAYPKNGETRMSSEWGRRRGAAKLGEWARRLDRPAPARPLRPTPPPRFRRTVGGAGPTPSQVNTLGTAPGSRTGPTLLRASHRLPVEVGYGHLLRLHRPPRFQAAAGVFLEPGWNAILKGLDWSWLSMDLTKSPWAGGKTGDRGKSGVNLLTEAGGMVGLAVDGANRTI